ncbi:MAG: hypothetical protein KAJ19_17905 [Gammaproteobacteria bacterium]|nr:hypothetical protein [Gammaproteobacteria bacterium]
MDAPKEWIDCPHCLGIGKIPNDTSSFNRVRSHFFLRYNQKAKDITGTDLRPDGKKIWPRFGPKEGSLVKRDINDHGEASIIKYLELFFSDQVKTVRNFTNGFKQKAGYGYNIFHSVIPKLELYRGKPILPCEECASWGAHRADCASYTRSQEQFEADREELEKIRDANPDIDVKGMFKAAQQRR